jgi:anti-sigma regulatory factor (Ser/Thr protein kinase)
VTATLPGTGMHHDALLYANDGQFATGVAAFVRQGLAAGELPVVVEPPRQIGLLRAELGADAGAVRFLDMTQVGANPARIIAAWQSLLDEAALLGVRLRGVGEPAWVGRQSDELIECRIHEQLLNVAFGTGVSWELLCPYNAAGLPAEAVAGAWQTHPHLVIDDAHHGSNVFDDDALADVFSGELDAAPGTAGAVRFGLGDIARVRAAIRSFARSARLSDARVEDLVLAANEVATNSVRHGGGSGTLAAWISPAAVVVEFADAGTISAPLVGRLRPGVRSYGGRGIYLVNQVCDLVQIRSGADGTRVRLTMWR